VARPYNRSNRKSIEVEAGRKCSSIERANKRPQYGDSALTVGLAISNRRFSREIANDRELDVNKGKLHRR
jgi:hypothetical protein